MSIKEVLIVDDDENVRVLLRRVLEGAGMLVTEADSVDQAIVMAVDLVPHLIILDLQMPGKNGFDFLDQKRALPAIATTPVLALIGHKFQDDVHRALTWGADDSITKPFQTTVVLKKVKKALLDREFLKIAFEAGQTLKACLTFPARISQINEVGCIVESSIGISPETPVSLKASLLNRFEIQDHVMKTASRLAQLSADRAFLNQVVFVGITEKPAKAIRRAVREWR